MWLKLRIIFTILSAICVAAVLPLGAWLSWLWAGIAVISAFLFYFLMLWCKSHQPKGLETEEKEARVYTEVERILKEVDINTLSPMQAFMLLGDLKEKLDEEK